MPQQDPIELWQHVHGATVHFALALALTSIAFDIGNVLFKKPEWRSAGFWTLIGATALAAPATFSGFWGMLGWFHTSKWDAIHLLTHRNIALAGAIGLLIVTLLRVATGDFGPRFPESQRRSAYYLYLAFMLLVAGAIGYAGFLGAYVARGY